MASDKLPPRFSSGESSPDGGSADKGNKEDKKGNKEDKGSKRKGQDLKKKPAKKSKCDEDDDDEDIDQEHDALPDGDGNDDDDDERDDFGLEGLDEILKIDGEEGSGKPSKKPATSNRGTKKKPSTRKRDEAHCYKHENMQWDFKPCPKT